MSFDLLSFWLRKMTCAECIEHATQSLHRTTIFFVFAQFGSLFFLTMPIQSGCSIIEIEVNRRARSNGRLLLLLLRLSELGRKIIVDHLLFPKCQSTIFIFSDRFCTHADDSNDAQWMKRPSACTQKLQWFHHEKGNMIRHFSPFHFDKPIIFLMT